MKLSNLSKLAGASVLSLSLAILPASAQTTTNGASGTNTTAAASDTGQSGGGGNGGYWGLLGLLGLFGLMGRGRDKGQATVGYRDPNEVGGGTGSRY